MKTLRIWLITALFIAGLLTVNGQSNKLYAGFKAGFGVPNLTTGAKSTPLNEDYSSRLGFYSGIVTEIQTRKHFGLHAEVNYSSQGGKRDGIQALPLPSEMKQLWDMLPYLGISTDGYMYANINSDAILNYLEIPIMAKLFFDLGPRLKFYFNAGPYMGVMLNAKNLTNGISRVYADKDGFIPIDMILQLAEQSPIGELDFSSNENIINDVHRLNFGGQGAIGIGLMMRSGKLFIEGGGNYGIVPIQKDAANGTNKTGAGTITLGYMFQL
jgi:hypothetical protein